jgi:hypothetical protein
MSVHKNKRGLSRLELYHTARQLRQDVTNLLLRDFGVRDKVRKIKTEDNLEVTIIEEYPEWLIRQFRENIMKILRDLMLNITGANTIYPQSFNELDQRRTYQNNAIVNCEQLIEEMTYCADMLPVKLEKFLPFVDKITFEVTLLRGWRKDNNRMRTDVAKKEALKQAAQEIAIEEAATRALTGQ